MPIEKQSLNNFLPNGFETLNQEGYKENFSEEKIKTGYEKDVPDIVSGSNLNNLIDVVGKNINTLNNYVEYLNGMPINNVPTVNANGQLDYTNLDDKLTKKQITNCITEIPQRIKYDLTDGTLTIKAGTVCIVPCGTEDLSTTYPVGATFLNDNFKVYDTQYTDGNFFVWAELLEDIVYQSGAITDTHIRSIAINVSNFGLSVLYNTNSGNDYTGASTMLYYNTSLNLVRRVEDTTVLKDYYSLPILQCKANNSIVISAITQVFNGLGYIGSTVWVDKGVKGLIPNEKNDKDGSLINIEWEYTSLYLRDLSSSVNNVYKFGLNGSSSSGISAYSYDEIKNINLSGTSRWNYTYAFDLIKSDGVITSFKSKQPFRAVDYNDYATAIDGKWVAKTTTIGAGVQITNSSETTFSLANYLPNDGNIYEVKFSFDWNAAGASGTLHTYVNTGYGSDLAFYATGGRGAQLWTGVVSTARTLTFASTSLSSGTNKINLRATAYRKVR